MGEIIKNVVVYTLAFVGVVCILENIIQEIKYRIGIRRYYKELYKERPELNPKNNGGK